VSAVPLTAAERAASSRALARALAALTDELRHQRGGVTNDLSQLTSPTRGRPGTVEVLGHGIRPVVEVKSLEPLALTNHT
jgi:hypothetical protein